MDGGSAAPAAAGTKVAVASGGLVRVAYAGEPGAFAEDAALAYFGGPGRLDGVPTGGFREVFEAVTAGGVPSDAPGAAPVVAGVVPIENLVNGTVRENYDLLLEHDLEIVGEVVVPVRLCLAALPGQPVEAIERVYSHIQALGQAERYLRTRPWALLTTYNTAGAAKLIVDRDERGAAAVLSPRAAALFGLEILADAIQDVPDNRTRFLVVERPVAGARPDGGARPDAGERRDAGEGSGARPASGAAADRAMRTTLVMAVRNEPGSLHRCLAVFADAGLNMSKLESRPSRTRAWEYVFWIDLDADAADPATSAALERLRAQAAMVRVLGSYPRAALG